MIFFVFADRFGWMPVQVGQLTITQVTALSYYMGDQAKQLNRDCGDNQYDKSGSSANDRARIRLMKQGIDPKRISDVSKMSSSELKKKFGGNVLHQ